MINLSYNVDTMTRFSLTPVWEIFKEIFHDYKITCKRILIGTVIGVAAGLLVSFFNEGLKLASSLRESIGPGVLIFLPFAGLLVIYLYEKFSKTSMQGIALVFKADQKKISRIPMQAIPLVILSTWITHLFGGSAGREGVALQLGAISAWYVGPLLAKRLDKHLFLVWGMAAGFAGIFGTPLAGALFAMEVLSAGLLQYSALAGTLAATFAAYLTGNILGVRKSHFNVFFNYTLNIKTVWPYIFLAIAVGICGMVFASWMRHARIWAAKWFPNPYYRIFYCSIPLAIMLFGFHLGRYCGLDESIIASCFIDRDIFFWDWFLKMLLTIWTLSIGFTGGEVTPLLTIGSSLGFVLGPYLGLPGPAAAMLGYAGILASGTNTYLAPIVLGCEVFGFHYFPLFFGVCSISYMINRNRSVYALQKKAKY